ncbi:hypothetical protein FD21_GL000312 [Liquorilactobacillus vini DSM 20605]|uniref:Cobalamin-independent methionine synthase MetE C-terminal/archaeal domain-containing protein n=1 Tax=Liquorilactobacillus vini DSM 20605 TaxID=1133569 RepID=A0A0R2C551_9LACO|nr:hypothetical protein FD21_GL000312 [Liquorilactobacillus vini DSM 20605]
MTNATATKLHYDIVGSFLRPAELKQSRAALAAGKITAEQLRTKIRLVVETAKKIW